MDGRGKRPCYIRGPQPRGVSNLPFSVPDQVFAALSLLLSSQAVFCPPACHLRGTMATESTATAAIAGELVSADK